jgi:predicted O-methyltransferase YrrM
MRELAVLVPTRGRPENIRKVIGAWDFTNAWDVADLILIADADDPQIQGYRDLFEETRNPDTDEPLFSLSVVGEWVPMVHKLNRIARAVSISGKYFAVGFAGDDHLPQTIGWAKRYLAALHELGTGMVYGDDGYQGSNLSTEWAITSDVVRALDRMVPADVEHMYCDNAMMDLFGGARAIRHLPEVRIEHMHPYAGKAETDEQYKRVNHRDQFKKDRRAYEGWLHGDVFRTDVAAVRHLRRGLPEFHLVKDEPRLRKAGLMPRAVPPRPRGQRVTKFNIPRHFKKVRAASSDEIGITLADYASQVPSDQAIVEIGVFQGWTALLMAWGARQGNGAHLWGVDPWELEGNTYGPPFTDLGSRTWAEYNVMAQGYSSVITLVQGFSENVAATWEGPQIGLLFIDGDHSYKGAHDDVLMWSAHLAPGAVIAIDDYGHPDWPGVAEAVDELVADGFLEPLQIFHDQLAVTRLTGRVDTEESTETPEQSAAIVDANLLASGSQGLTAVTSEGVSPEPTADPRLTVADGELRDVAAGTGIDSLNTQKLRMLAKARGIVLGDRKDSRGAMLQALRDGQ